MHATPVRGPGSSRGDRTRYVFATIAALVGLLWILQGLGVLPGSFMSGDTVWAWIGIGLLGAAILYGAWPRLRRR
jgi:hypothetical protein